MKKLIKNCINKTRAFLVGLSDFNYLIIQIKNTLNQTIPLSKGYYDFFDVFFNRINRGTKSENYFFVDIGANDGWFAKVVYRFAPNASVFSFEPLKSQIPALKNLKKILPNFEFNELAIGNKAEELEINEFTCSGISSILELDTSVYDYENRGKDTAVAVKYKVRCSPLDDFFEVLLNKKKQINVLKIDTQGYELKVLQGAEKLLSTGFFDYIMLEVMTISKYKGGPLYLDILNFLDKHNYNICEVFPSCREQNGWVSECDIIFSKQLYHL